MLKKVLVKDIKRLLKEANKPYWKYTVFASCKQTCLEIRDDNHHDEIATYLRKKNISLWRSDPFHLPNTFECYIAINLLI